MWTNIFGILSKQPSEQGAEEDPNSNPEIKINYAHIQNLYEKIGELKSINIFTHPTSEIAYTFEEVMGVLHGLLNVVVELKHAFE